MGDGELMADYSHLEPGTSTVVEDAPSHQVVVHRSAAGWAEEIVWKPGFDPLAPGTPGGNQEAIIAKLTAALDALEAADATWGSLTTAQRLAAAQLAVRVSAKLARLTLGRLEAS